MKKKLVYVLFACLAMVNMALGQQKVSRLILNPEVPVAGQRLELTYNPKGGPLEGKSDLVGIIYMDNVLPLDPSTSLQPRQKSPCSSRKNNSRFPIPAKASGIHPKQGIYPANNHLHYFGE